MAGEEQFLFIREGQEPSGIEQTVQDAIKEMGYSIKTSTIQSISSESDSANVIFYQPSEPISPINTELFLKGIRAKRSDSAIVIVSKQTLEQKLLDSLKPAYHISTDSTISKILNTLQTIKKEHLSKRKYWALVVTPEDDAVYKKVLQKSGYEVECKTGVIQPEELGQYEAHKIDFDIILLEDQQINKCAAMVKEKFPHAFFVAVGAQQYKKSAYSSGIPVFYNKTKDCEALELFARDILCKKRVEPKPTRDTGKCYLFAGPTCTGKTKAALSLKNNPYVRFIQKHTTRKKRPYEKKGEDFQFKTKEELSKVNKGRPYLVTFTYNGNKYGIPPETADLLETGMDTIITATDFDSAKEIKAGIEEKVRQGIVVPILFFANSNILKSRLIENRPEEEVMSRINDCSEQLRIFFDNEDMFKYGINTGASAPKEVQRILKGIIDWEHNYSNQHYTDVILKSVLPKDFFRTATTNNSPITLRIPGQVIEAYSAQKKVSIDDLRKVQEQPVECVSMGHGRVGVFLKAPNIDEKETLLDLIERTIELEPRSRNYSNIFTPISYYAKCCSPNETTTYNDGLLYMLGDDFRDKAQDEYYAVSFGFAKPADPSQKFCDAMPLRKLDIDYWNHLTNMLRKFPPSITKPK